MAIFNPRVVICLKHAWTSIVRPTGETMHHLAYGALRFAIVALAVLRGLAEFASLQRWRVREWMAR